MSDVQLLIGALALSNALSVYCVCRCIQMESRLVRRCMQVESHAISISIRHDIQQALLKATPEGEPLLNAMARAKAVSIPERSEADCERIQKSVLSNRGWFSGIEISSLMCIEGFSVEK